MSIPPKSAALPAPSPAEADRSDALRAVIDARIARSGGSIAFSEFMELALYAPGLGYYSGPRQRFGEGGDFTTAPEISPLFGEVLARPVAEVLRTIRPADVLEAGAGTGQLATQVLRSLAALDALPEHYWILEVSADLRGQQAETLRAQAPDHFARVRWLDRLPDAGFRGVVLANELLDALPVARFVARPDGVRELRVMRSTAGFDWLEGPAGAAMSERVTALALPQQYVSEINFAAEAWVRSIGERLAAGLILLIDYGFPRAEYYHPDRSAGTLMCHYRHRAHPDPLILVGLQDITAHIDFTAIARAGLDTGLTLAGYTSQAAFLLGSGLDELIGRSDPEAVRVHLALMQQVKKLTLPTEMGELFKVLGLARGMDVNLSGFTLHDRRMRL